MTDREKILIWLDKCLGVCNENTNCDLCPFDKLGTYGYNCAEQLEDAIRRELLNEQPAKIKTLHEFQHNEMEGAIVWLETNDDTLYWLCPDPDGHWSGWALHHEDLPDSTKFLTFGVDLPTYLSDNEYGKTWRIWTSKPTTEQMRRAIWLG